MIEKVNCGRKLHGNGNADARETTLSIKKMRFEPEKSRKRIFFLRNQNLQKGAQAPFSLFNM